MTDSNDLVFNTLIEGLFVIGLRGRMTPALLRDLRAAGIDLERKLDPAYPLEVFRKGLLLAASALYPELPPEQAMYNIGRHACEGYARTLVGRAMFPLLRLIGPQRTLQRMSRNFQGANNFTRAELKKIGENEAELWMSKVTHADYYRGLIEPALAATGAQSPKVEITGRENGGATFRITWR